MRWTRSGSTAVLMLLSGILLAPGGIARADNAEVFVGDVLVGVDHLGRVLLAVDKQPLDGRVDHCFLFTATDRLEGTWSRRIKARVIQRADSLSVRSPFFVVSLALTDGAPQKIGHGPRSEVFEQYDGVEITRLNAGPEGGAQLESMVVEDLSTWPEAFWYDVHDPESCVGGNSCISGGPGSSSCSLTLHGVSCNVACTGNTFACCSETPQGGVSCRCIPCEEGPDRPGLP